eukprot:g48724.t1
MQESCTNGRCNSSLASCEVLLKESRHLASGWYCTPHVDTYVCTFPIRVNSGPPGMVDRNEFPSSSWRGPFVLYSFLADDIQTCEIQVPQEWWTGMSSCPPPGLVPKFMSR